jgi:hypothetical protein
MSIKNLSFGFCVVALLTLSRAAISQEELIKPNTIEHVPPFAKAVLTRDSGYLSKLLETRENVNERVLAKEGARAGFTPLILAAAISDTEMAQMLIRHGAKITILDDYHRSALWYAALHENVRLTEVLISATGVSDVINAADNDFDRTPLHLAVRGSRPEVVTLLLKVGASRDQKDILGDTPVSYCKRRITEACKALL